MNSKAITEIFRAITKILDLKGENPFRIRAYERAAQNIEGLGNELETLFKQDALTSVPGIGKDLADKIKEMITTGSLQYYEKLKSQIPPGLLEMLEIPGLGPKTVKLIYEKTGIDTVDKLEQAAGAQKLRTIEGIRAKTEENILRGIDLRKKVRQRTPVYLALDIANKFIQQLSEVKEVERIEPAGSLRRRKDTIRDIDLLVVSRKPSSVMEQFLGSSLVKEVLARGETKSSVISKENMQVDLRVVERDSFGSALMYFTGSKEFNIKLRQLAIKKRYKINEYGVFSVSSGGHAVGEQTKEKRIAGTNEKEIFSLMNMEYIPPELREDRGEIEAALKNKLPKIIGLNDIRGDLHVHSTYSDGIDTLEGIAKKAQELGYEYAGVCDHSQGLKIAGGLSTDDVYKKLKEIKKVNQKSPVKLLCGAEVDILSDGSLDYPDSVLKELDLVVAAIHSGFKQSKAQLTKRIVSACKNKYVHIIAHPTGRLWGQREGYEIDLDEILKAAYDCGVALEINCFPYRVDFNDRGALVAKRAGVKLALGTDAHQVSQMTVMELGVSVARRGWLEKKDVINCMSLKGLLAWLKR